MRLVKKIEDKRNNEFWERENKANDVRRKNIDYLDYIKLPIDFFPFHCLEENETIVSYQNTIKELSTKRILNLTGFTNTDLKLEYGVANLPDLSEYDQNYIQLISTIQQWAKALYDNEYYTEAIQLLEFALSIKTDISQSYMLLTACYKKLNMDDKIEPLLSVASTLSTPLKPSILKHLEAELSNSHTLT